MSQQTKEIKQLVRQIVKTVHPRKIILFGSRARGTARKDSDIDLAVVMPNGTNRLHTSMKLHRKVRQGKIPCDWLVVTPKEFDRYSYHPSLVYKYILDEGKEVYAAR